MKKGILATMIATTIISSAATFVGTVAVCQMKTEKYVKEQLYPRTAIVTEINRKADYVEVECANGNKYYFYGAHDYEIGDIVSLIAKQNVTKRVVDDVVVSHRYDGFLQLLEEIEVE